jgi:hypothetical protein
VFALDAAARPLLSVAYRECSKEHTMKRLALAAALAGMLAFSLQAFAQSTSERPGDGAKSPTPATQSAPNTVGSGSSAAPAGRRGTFTHGESKRCESMSGADKELCDKEEATKAEGKEAEDVSKKPQQSPKQ